MIDFEAAAKELAIRCDGILDEDWSHHSPGIVERAREDARAVIEAALGDRAIYEKHPCDGDHFIPKGARCLEPTWVQVWPVKETDE